MVILLYGKTDRNDLFSAYGCNFLFPEGELPDVDNLHIHPGTGIKQGSRI